MDNNVIIRHTGVFNEQSFDTTAAEFAEAFEGFEGVSVLNSEDNGTKFTKIFLTSDNRIYIKLAQASGYGLRVSVHCSEGQVNMVDYYYIDDRPNDAQNFTYNIVRTQYGVAFTTMPRLNSTTQCLSDGYFQSFFTTFQKQNGERVNGFVFSITPNDIVYTNSSQSYMITELHQGFEQIDFSKCFFGSDSNQTVLANLPSYSYPIIADHLYKKLMTENNKFGKIMINNRRFVSGSHLCLEMGSDEQM